MFRTLRARLALAYVTLIVAALLLLAWLLIGITQNLYTQNLRAQLLTDSRLAAEIVAPLLDGDATAIDAVAKRLGADAQTRVTIIRRDGVVLGDSDESPANMDNHADRPEVQRALATGYGEATRFSRTLQTDLLYVATTVQRDGAPVAVVRVAVPLRAVDDARAQIAGAMLGVGSVVALVAVAVAVVIARHTTDSLAHLERVAARLARGDWQARARAVEPLEVNHLAATLNHMAEQLGATIQTLQREQTRMASILAHMADGLLLVDARGAVTQINQAAEKILDARAGEAVGKSFTQVVRDHELAECLRRAQAMAQEQTRVVERSGAHRFLRMVATPVPAANAPQTYLVMLQDLTPVRRLEMVRRDFISNVSHELRTPLAALQALVETLNDGALEDLHAARGFVAQMEDEVHHLTQLVNDLLDLSSVESGTAPIQRAPVDLSAIVARAAERLQPQATRAGVSLVVMDAPAAIVNADGARLEQVMLNLIHNAIKFTPSDGQIECRVAAHAEHVTVSVRDTGVGIGAADLPRIFERFYKVDKARAGGGTGLGLAIAKHIVELHGGQIWAESNEGHGTTIVFTLPLG
ncbi:MAG: ATP-binding protein [Chloroflexota bacterium]